MNHPCKRGISLLIYLTLFLLYGTSVLCQEPLDLQSWINKRKAVITSKNTSLTTNDFNPSWIRELEFRTETEDFLLDKQEFLIRYRPNLPGERAAQSRLIEVSRQEWDINLLNFENELNRYLLDELLLIRQINHELEIIAPLLQIYYDQRVLIADEINSGRFNIKDLSQIDDDIRSLERKQKNHQFRIDLLTRNGILPDTDQLISIMNLYSQFEAFNLSGMTSINQEERSFELNKVGAEIELEKVEGSRIFDFIQLRYNGPHSDLLSERLALGMNIQFPNAAGNKLRVEELQVEKLIRQQEYQYEQQLESLRLAEEINEFSIFLEQWNDARQLIDQQQKELDSMVNLEINVEYVDPASILFQKERLLKLKSDQISLEEEIYDAYFDLLERTTLLGENRFSPYLWD